MVGDDVAILVKAVSTRDGRPFKGEVTLGFEVPEGVFVQRAETYSEQNELASFPQFFRVVNRETGAVFGYSFEPSAEGSTLSYGYDNELVTDYDEMTDADHRLAFYLFRSEAEAEACVLGVSASDVVGVDLGVVKHTTDRRWVVMIDYYREPPLDVNPEVRS